MDGYYVVRLKALSQRKLVLAVLPPFKVSKIPFRFTCNGLVLASNQSLRYIFSIPKLVLSLRMFHLAVLSIRWIYRAQIRSTDLVGTHSSPMASTQHAETKMLIWVTINISIWKYKSSFAQKILIYFYSSYYAISFLEWNRRNLPLEGSCKL